MRVINFLDVNHNHLKNIVSDDVMRPVMTGVYFDLLNNCIVGTNSHVLMVIPVEIEWSETELKITKNERNFILQKQSKIVPLELFDKRKYMGEPKYYLNPIHYDFSDESYAQVFNGPECVFRCKYIEGKFPNYEAVFPKTEKTELSEIGVNLDMVLRLYKALPVLNCRKNLRFELFGKNKTILFTNKETEIKGVLMPVIEGI